MFGLCRAIDHIPDEFTAHLERVKAIVSVR